MPNTAPTSHPCSIAHSQSLVGLLEEALLVSAYDIHHGFLVDSTAFSSNFHASRYAKPKVLVIDSGWYEKNGSPPAGPFSKDLNEPRDWNETDYKSTIDNLDEDLTPIVVSWDEIGPYAEQIRRSQEFFGDRTHIASSLLLKPPLASKPFHALDQLSDADAKNLRAFDIIGVTERELGDNAIDRLVGIASLRSQLDKLDVSSPIHVFGGLDPLFTPLYFAAGAELFDGLGWLRYAYREGVAMHRDAGMLFDEPINRRFMAGAMFVAMRNLTEIGRLAEGLRRFAFQHDWSVFPRGQDLRDIFYSVQARAEALNGR
ncbi:MAG: hypothetical protein OXT70_03565 [Chloroflexota bacterium]|nr:hypothetical protein [Chloroflexota bacterium]